MVDFLGVLIILFWATSFSSPTHPPWRYHIHIRCPMLMGCAWPIQQSLLTIPGPESDCTFSANDIVLPCLIRRRFSTVCNFCRLLVSLFFNGDTEDNRIRAHTHRREEGRTSQSLRRPPSHSSSPSSFTLTWSDIDSHFSSIQSSLTRQFDLLQCQNDVVPEILQKYVPPSHPRLKLLCSNMDANGLTRYIIDHSKDRQEIASELPDAFRVAPVPAKLVLDALQGFFPPNEVDNEGNKLGSLMQTRLLLLEQLTAVLPEIKADVMQRAKYLAQEWKGKINRGAVTSNDFLGFLYLLAAYGMGSDFDSSEYVEFLANVVVQNRQQGFTLCCRLNCVDKVPAHVKKFENLAQNVYDSWNHSLQYLNGATGAEISILKQIISCLEEYKLEAEYPREHLEMRIKMLEREMKDRKRSAAAPLAPRHQQPQELGSKHPWTKPAGAAVPSVAGASSTINPFN